MDACEFLKHLGYDTRAYHDFIPNILLWKEWYKGNVQSFHTYDVYNGVKTIKLKRMSLQMPKFICEKIADLLFNEKVNISLNDENSTNTLNEILSRNNFQLMMNRAIELSFAMGTGCITAGIDNIIIKKDGTKSNDFSKSNVKLQYINAENIYPLSWDGEIIKEIAAITYEKCSTGQYKCIINLHVLNDVGNYVIKNYQFLTDFNKNIISEYLKDTYVTEFDTKSNVPWFAIIKPNIKNNIDIYSPYGISIFANSLDIIQGIDINYDSFINEIKLGRKRLFTTKEVLRFNPTTGQNEFNFDPNDIIFHVLGDGFSENDGAKNYIQEINGNLRIDEHVNALNTNMKMLGAKTGFGIRYFTFDENTYSPKTATEVENSNNVLYATVSRHEILLRVVVEDIVRAIGVIGQITNQFHIDTDEINIQFDDSIIQNEDKEREEDRKDLSQNTLSRERYIQRWRNVDSSESKEWVKEIDGEEPEKGSVELISGEIN